MASSHIQDRQKSKDIKTKRKKSRINYEDNQGSTLPGVQKLKAALRQTRRLLAKDTLSADIRVESERKLRSLEADLRTAEQKRKERAMAVKYHKVKFFERRKALRKINQIKRELKTTASDSSSSKASTAHLENSLLEHRVDLNYILRYPKLEKYISLYPPSHSEEAQTEPTSSTALVSGTTDSRREQLRGLVREKMEAGEFPMEPELELESVSGDEDKLESHTGLKKGADLARKSKDGRRLRSTTKSRGDESDAWDSMENRVKEREKAKSKSKQTNTTEQDRYEDDDFFDHGSEGNGTDSDE